MITPASSSPLASSARPALTASPVPPYPSISPDCFPPRLADLGFTGRVLCGVEIITPPVCDVSAGEFLMGSDPRQDRDAEDSELPHHLVTLPAYQIARFPLTVAEYACWVRVGGRRPRIYGGVNWGIQLPRLDHPVVCVTWRDANNYAAWLAQLTGEPWRLPTEAEWEKAARWDPATRYARIYPWGDAFDRTRANTVDSGKGNTAPVGTYPNGASPCGAQDMAGNVWEWTRSLFKSYPYQPTKRRERAGITDRVLRGGSCDHFPRYARAAFRHRRVPAAFGDRVGFRLMRDVPGS